MTRLQLFQGALTATKDLGSKYPAMPAVQSIIRQLEYLVDLEGGNTIDRSKLTSITIGVMTAREIEPLDMDVAEQLHAVSAEVRLMLFGR